MQEYCLTCSQWKLTQHFKFSSNHVMFTRGLLDPNRLAKYAFEWSIDTKTGRQRFVKHGQYGCLVCECQWCSPGLRNLNPGHCSYCLCV